MSKVGRLKPFAREGKEKGKTGELMAVVHYSREWGRGVNSPMTPNQFNSMQFFMLRFVLVLKRDLSHCWHEICPDIISHVALPTVLRARVCTGLGIWRALGVKQHAWHGVACMCACVRKCANKCVHICELWVR